MDERINARIEALSEKLEGKSKREFRMIAIAIIISLIVFAVAMQKLFNGLITWLK